MSNIYLDPGTYICFIYTCQTIAFNLHVTSNYDVLFTCVKYFLGIHMQLRLVYANVNAVRGCRARDDNLGDVAMSEVVVY